MRTTGGEGGGQRSLHARGREEDALFGLEAFAREETTKDAPSSEERSIVPKGKGRRAGQARKSPSAEAAKLREIRQLERSQQNQGAIRVPDWKLLRGPEIGRKRGGEAKASEGVIEDRATSWRSRART